MIKLVAPRSDGVCISTATLHSIIHRYLEISNISSRCIPKLLCEQQDQPRISAILYKADKEFLERIITSNGSWFHFY